MKRLLPAMVLPAALLLLPSACTSTKTACEQLSEKVVVCMSNVCSDLSCEFCETCVAQNDEAQCEVILGLDGGAQPFICEEQEAQAALKSFTCAPYDQVVMQLCP